MDRIKSGEKVIINEVQQKEVPKEILVNALSVAMGSLWKAQADCMFP